MSNPSSSGGALRLLLRNDALRLAEQLRHPRPGTWLAVLLPAVLGAGGLWLAADSVRPDAADGGGRILLGALATVAPSLWAYPLLFRPGDDGFLRRLGFAAEALYALRALRLLLLSLAAVALLMVPYAAGGIPLGQPLTVALGGALAGWGCALWAHARAAHRLAFPARETALSAKLLGWDSELVSAGSMVYAPLYPLLLGVVGGRFASAGGAGEWGWRLAVVLAVSAGLAALGRRRWAVAYPRFAPRAGEMAFAPAPGAGETGLVIGRGLPGLLPRRVGAVRARDAVVVERRWRWAGRAGWTVGIVGLLALFRAGDSAAVRAWVGAAAVLVLGMQAVAVVALGRLERAGPRWIDRSAGIRRRDRFAGRWATAFGLAMTLVVPVALAWGLAVPTSPGWPWLLAGAGSAGLAAAASLAAAGR